MSVPAISNVLAAPQSSPLARRSPGGDFATILSLAGSSSSGASPSASSNASAPQQVIAGGTSKLEEALAAFKKEAAMTPAQRARRDVLKEMKLTEDDIKAMPPEQKASTEKTIAAEVARRLQQAAQKTAGAISVQV